MARPGQPQGQKPRKLSRGQAAEDSLDRLDTRKSARGPGQKPKATKPGQPKTFGKPDGKRMRNDGRAADGAGGEKRPHTPGGGRPQRPAGGGPAGRGRGNADRRR